MTALVLTPFTAGDAVELGMRTWRKKLLPVGDVEYKGRLLHFTKDYLGQLVTAFQNRAYDQVPFQLADAQNTHTNDPERTRGEITGMELGDDGLYVTAELTPDGEKVLAANPRLGVSARIVEDYARSDGKRFTAAVQHVLGTLDPRIPGLGPWEAIEAASPVPDEVIDLSASSFAGEEPVMPFIDLDWATWDAEHGSGQGLEEHEKAQATARATARRDAMAKGAAGFDRGGSDEEKAANHIADAKRAAQMGQHQVAMQHLARATQLSDSPAVYQQASQLSKGVKQMAMQSGNGTAASWATLSNEGTDSMPDPGNLTDGQRQRLARLLELPDETLDALAAGGMVLTPEEAEALTAPGETEGSEDEGADDMAALIDAMSDDELAALEAEFDAETQSEYEPEGEPVTAGLSAEAQFAIDLANARAEETQREMSVIQARLREEDYQAEKRRLADLGVPPFITELAKPLLEGAGHAVELANGKTVDAGAVMRRVLTEYARQARLLDLDVELGSPMDEPEGVRHEEAEQSRAQIVNGFKAMTGLK